MAVAAVVTTAVTFLPWGRSGERARSSYELVDVVDRAELVPASWEPAAAVWYFVPVMCGAVLVAVAATASRTAGVLASTLGLIVVVGAVVVARSPLVIEPAAQVGLAGGALTFVAGFTGLLAAVRESRES